MNKLIKSIILSLLIVLLAAAAEAITPTKANISYGPYARNTLDLWLAKSDKPTPLLVYIHGGGWNGNDKSQIMGRVKIDFWNKKGVSVASINYRLIKDAILPAPVHDAVRAIQFLKHKAADFNIKPDRIALRGVSAGACTALYILLHDDFADPQAHDPVLRQSSRVAGAIVQSAQTSIEPHLLQDWIGDLAANYPMIWSSVGAKNAVDHQKNYQKYKLLSEEFSPINHLDENDPPAYLSYDNDLSVPAKTPANAIHHGHFGIRFQEKADEVGYTCYLSIKGVTQPDPMVYPQSFLARILLQ